MLPFKSLDSADATGAGVSRDLEGIYDSHTLQVTDGTFIQAGDSLTVALQGSLDGSVWFTMTSVQVLYPFSSQGVYSNHAVRYVRANLTSLGAGSHASDVTAWIASAKSD